MLSVITDGLVSANLKASVDGKHSWDSGFNSYHFLEPNYSAAWNWPDCMCSKSNSAWYPLMTVPRCGCVGKRLNVHGSSYFLAYSTSSPFHLGFLKLVIFVYFRAHNGEEDRGGAAFSEDKVLHCTASWVNCSVFLCGFTCISLGLACALG